MLSICSFPLKLVQKKIIFPFLTHANSLIQGLWKFSAISCMLMTTLLDYPDYCLAVCKLDDFSIAFVDLVLFSRFSYHYQ